MGYISLLYLLTYLSAEMHMARFWTDSNASDCAAVNPESHTEQAYSSIGRTTDI